MDRNSETTPFGTRSFPPNSPPLYGRYEQDLGARQARLAAKLRFRERGRAKIARCEA